MTIIDVAQELKIRYTWALVDSSAVQKRIKSAFTLYEKMRAGHMEIETRRDGGEEIFLVPSSGQYGNIGARWTVRPNGPCPSCTCPDWHRASLRQKGPVVFHVCKHIIWVNLIELRFGGVPKSARGDQHQSPDREIPKPPYRTLPVILEHFTRIYGKRNISISGQRICYRHFEAGNGYSYKLVPHPKVKGFYKVLGRWNRLIDWDDGVKGIDTRIPVDGFDRMREEGVSR